MSTHSEKLYFYPVWIRVWHLINALMFLALIITGLDMQYASKEGTTLLRFDQAVSIHNVCGIILSINYVFFFLANMITGNWKYYKLQFKGFFVRLFTQMKYYLFGIFKGEKAPYPLSMDRKFNPLQQFTYIGVMYFFVPLVCVTGVAMLYPQMIIEQFFNVSGLFLTDLFHISAGFLGSMFLLIHVYFCTIGTTPTSNFKGMVDGYHQAHD